MCWEPLEESIHPSVFWCPTAVFLAGGIPGLLLHSCFGEWHHGGSRGLHWPLWDGSLQHFSPLLLPMLGAGSRKILSSPASSYPGTLGRQTGFSPTRVNSRTLSLPLSGRCNWPTCPSFSWISAQLLWSSRPPGRQEQFLIMKIQQIDKLNWKQM